MTIERWTDDRIDRLSTNIEALYRIAQLQQDKLAGTRAQFLVTIDRLTENVTERCAGQERYERMMSKLHAGQERQERILDYLIRRDGQKNDPA